MDASAFRSGASARRAGPATFAQQCGSSLTLGVRRAHDADDGPTGIATSSREHTEQRHPRCASSGVIELAPARASARPPSPTRGPGCASCGARALGSSSLRGSARGSPRRGRGAAASRPNPCAERHPRRLPTPAPARPRLRVLTLRAQRPHRAATRAPRPGCPLRFRRPPCTSRMRPSSLRSSGAPTSWARPWVRRGYGWRVALTFDGAR
jgi:hypothetical protein